MFLEIGLIDRAKRAHPIGGQVFEFSAWGNSVVRVANCGVIDITAYFANILFHGSIIINNNL